MPRSTVSVLALVLTATLLLAATGCGEEDADLLPGSTAREITSNLETVQHLADEGDCAGAEGAAFQVGEQVEAVEGVDPRLKRALTQGAARLEEVVTQCEEELEATEPSTAELEAEEEDDRAAEQLEKEEEREEKEEEKREKEEEKQEAGEGNEGKGGGPPPSVPPSEGEGGGNEGEGGGPPPAVEEDPSSGGVSPANPAGGG